MSLRRHPISAVPAETAHVAQAVFPKGNLYMTLRDELGTLYTDEDFADLFPTHGQPAACPWRLALICVLEFVEHLSTGKRPRPSAVALTGKMPSGSSSPTPASTFPRRASSARAWSRVTPRYGFLYPLGGERLILGEPLEVLTLLRYAASMEPTSFLPSRLSERKNDGEGPGRQPRPETTMCPRNPPCSYPSASWCMRRVCPFGL